MRAEALAGVLLIAAPLFAAGGPWVLATSTLGLSERISHAARGRGTCGYGQCSFRIEALVKSFESGDPDRDVHTILATRGAQFPLVTLRMSMPDAALSAANFVCDVEVDYAGRTAKYGRVSFQVSMTTIGMRMVGT